jgi:hypothetical protein
MSCLSLRRPVLDDEQLGLVFATQHVFSKLQLGLGKEDSLDLEYDPRFNGYIFRADIMRESENYGYGDLATLLERLAIEFTAMARQARQSQGRQTQ